MIALPMPPDRKLILTCRAPAHCVLLYNIKMPFRSLTDAETTGQQQGPRLFFEAVSFLLSVSKLGSGAWQPIISRSPLAARFFKSARVEQEHPYLSSLHVEAGPFVASP